MAEQLTLQQRQAVEDRGGMLLVSAAAGSGKTKVLVDRLLGYMTDPVHPANIDDFLIITYTKAAAAELRGKIAAKLSERLAQEPDHRHLQRQMQRLYLAKISTVHSFCTDLLREYDYELGLAGDFRVADEGECRVLRELAMEQTLDEAYRDHIDDPDFRAFVDTQGLGRSDRQVPQIVEQLYSAARCHLDPEAWLERCIREFEPDAEQDVGSTVWGECLIRDLKEYVSAQICALECCIKQAESDPMMEKPVANLRETVAGLVLLVNAKNWDEILQCKDVPFGRLTFSKKIADPELPPRIKAVRDSCKEGLRKKLKVFVDPSATVMEDLIRSAPSVRGLVWLTKAFTRCYEELKRRRRAMDFSDLEHRALDLLRGKRRGAPTRIADEVGSRFREVLVDEYQDSNQVQDSIFSALTYQRGNCFMVGDVKQSIYRFRLADPEIFLKKYETYDDVADARPGYGRKVFLSDNFRSCKAVLEAANDVFRLCMSKKVGGLAYTDVEALKEGIPHEPLPEPEVELHVISTNEDASVQEANFVADHIAKLLDGTHMVRGKEGLRPIAAEDIVILMRAPGSVGKEFLSALAAKGIRCAYSGDKDLLKTGEISVLRAILQVIGNPRQDIPLMCVLASPVFGFSADDLASIRAGKRSMELYEALLLSDTEKARKFLQVMDALRTYSRSAPLSALVEEVLRVTRMDSIYAAMADGVERTSNIRAFYSIAVEFENASGKDLALFLEHLDALEESGISAAREVAGGCVTIMSIHKSKGLEFPVVFLCGLARKFNQQDLIAPILCDSELGLGMSVVDRKTRVRYPTVAKRAIAAKTHAEGISEELRVLYVAMTRARDRLIMTYAAKDPEKKLQKLALRQDLTAAEQTAAEAMCPGDWILMEAMRRTEAGELFALAGCRGAAAFVRAYPWLIRTHSGLSTQIGEASDRQPAAEMPQRELEQMREGLAFRYGHAAATAMPSKQTATQLKGRHKDAEAAEQTRQKPSYRRWREPDFAQRHTKTGAEYGTAMHRLMQYIDFHACVDEAQVQLQLKHLTERGLLETEDASLIDTQAVVTFFSGELGRELASCKQVLREFKFSILDDGTKYASGLEGEQVLVQGVVDCAMIDEDGITVVDFKTDRISAERSAERALSYRAQVLTYASALERIFQKPVKRKLLYFFHCAKLEELM